MFFAAIIIQKEVGIRHPCPLEAERLILRRSVGLAPKHTPTRATRVVTEIAETVTEIQVQALPTLAAATG
jgi:hypothetical protein